MTNFLDLARQQIADADAYDPDALTDNQVLALVQRYHADVAADFWESHWRKQLSTLAGADPLVGALLAAEWLVKGPEALQVLAGGESEFIATEAAIISMFSPATPKTPQDVAAEVAGRFRFWISGGMLLTALRRATQHLIWAQTTPEGCAAAFARMKVVAEELIAMTLAGATREAVMARMIARAAKA